MHNKDGPLIHGQGYLNQTYQGDIGKDPCTGTCQGDIAVDILCNGADHPGRHDSQKDRDKTE